jgi:putative SOS response-associated peptidase YedK
MVVRNADGRRVREAMTWGFPRRLKTMKPTSKPLKVNNTRDDKLDTPFWKDSFAKRRCLIPVTAWAEAEGEAGKMTKTWYSLPDTELITVAGIWRNTVEWGDAYAMVMTEACSQMQEVHDRMPIILEADEWDQWMLGTPDEAKELVKTYDCRWYASAPMSCGPSLGRRLHPHTCSSMRERQPPSATERLLIGTYSDAGRRSSPSVWSSGAAGVPSVAAAKTPAASATRTAAKTNLWNSDAAVEPSGTAK